jgi:hypothetical protein
MRPTAHDLYYAEPAFQPISLDYETVSQVIQLACYNEPLSPVQQMIYDLSSDDAHQCRNCSSYVGLSLSGDRDQYFSWGDFYVMNEDADQFLCSPCFEEIEDAIRKQEESMFPAEEEI